MFDFWIGKFYKGEGLTSALANVSEPLAVFADYARRATLEAFAVHGHQNHGGEAWAPWSIRSADWHKRHGEPEMLVKTGALRSSVFVQTEYDGDAIIVRVGARDWKAYLHQQGGYVTDGAAGPKREIVVVTADDRSRAARLIERHLRIAINGRA